MRMSEDVENQSAMVVESKLPAGGRRRQVRPGNLATEDGRVKQGAKLQTQGRLTAPSSSAW